VRLNLPFIILIARGEVRRRIRIALHRPQHPVENRLAKGAAIRIAQSPSVADGNIPLPTRYSGCEVLEVALALCSQLVFRDASSFWKKRKTHIRIRNVAAATKHKENRLPPILRRCLILQQPAANHADSVHTTIPNIIHRLHTPTAKSRRHDLRRIHIRIRARARRLAHPVNRCLHRVLV
jgi:hypothetical protein